MSGHAKIAMASIIGALSLGVAGCMKNEGPVMMASPDPIGDSNAADGLDAGAIDSGDEQADQDAAGNGDAFRESVVEAASDGGGASDITAKAIDAPVDLAFDTTPNDLGTNLKNGRACRVGGNCHSGNCIDGVCCDTGCEIDQSLRCNSCLMANTGQPDGVCAADRNRERMKCGTACAPSDMGAPAVLEMTCRAGACSVPSAPAVDELCGKPFDKCTTSVCNQASARDARCVDTLCPSAGTCCCQVRGGDAQRTCVILSACVNGLICVAA